MKKVKSSKILNTNGKKIGNPINVIGLQYDVESEQIVNYVHFKHSLTGSNNTKTNI